MNHLENQLQYSRGHRTDFYPYPPFGQYCTTATITPDGRLRVVLHADLDFKVVKDTELSKNEFDELASLINAWREEGSEHGHQFQEEYGIHSWDNSAYWTTKEDIQAPKLKQLVSWLQANISLGPLPFGREILSGD